jgi:hypothetical protein
MGLDGLANMCGVDFTRQAPPQIQPIFQNPRDPEKFMKELTMNTTNERMLILRMIEDGKISAEEGAKLLTSVDAEPKNQPSAAMVSKKPGSPQWFRVRVSDSRSGKMKALVNLPIGLMDWGLRVGAQFAPEMEGLDLNELSEVLRSGADGKIVEVYDEEDGEHVEIYIE